MNKSRETLELILPEIGRVLGLITVTIIFSLFFVMGVIISIVEGAFVFDEIGYITFTPLLISGLALSAISALVLFYVFLAKNWSLSVKKPTPISKPPAQRPPEQHGYRPIDHQL